MMRKTAWYLLTIFIFSITFGHIKFAFGYLCTEELRIVCRQLNELRDSLDELSASETLPTNLIETIFIQLNEVEILVSQAQEIYNSHSLMLLNECEDVILPSQFSLMHREQPLIILNIRRFLESIRTEFHSLRNDSEPEFY